MYTYYQNGTLMKKKPHPENANYQVILPIRALLLKQMDIKKYKALLALQSHRKERAKFSPSPLLSSSSLSVVQQFKLQEAHEDMIQNLCGIFDTNCFEMFPTGAGDTVSGIFPNAAMMMHSCYKNTRLTFSDDFVLTILARTEIKKGQPINHTYARTLNTTTIRRIGLFSGKHFGCECVRCKDPSELGTYSSALLCTCGDTITPQDPLDLTQQAVWKCQGCTFTLPALQVVAQERDVMMELNSLTRDDIKGLEEFIARHKKQLHQNHTMLMEAKKHLTNGYGHYPGYGWDNLSIEKIKKKVDYCKNLIEILTILEPGLSTQKGLTLYELWLAEAELVTRLRAEGKIEEEEWGAQMKNSLDHLKEASRILQYEPENSIYGKKSIDIDNELARQIIR